MHENEEERERAVLVALDMEEYDMESSLMELEELADTAGVDCVGHIVQKRDRPDKASFVGSGKLLEIAEFAEANDVDLLIFDHELSATQIRNIEKACDVRTIDRTMLILDIFAERAVTKEGRLQVGLARQKYMLPRLRGMGITLSRIGGGAGGGAGARRGAGETKLETDRRHIEARIIVMEKELKELEARRRETRSGREKSGVQVVAILGYTNVGKSSLINALTGAEVLAEDKLFATLDPTARKLELPDGRQVVIIDTVGFLRRLPHHLVKAFHSTLEVATEADLILNVCDAANPEAEEQIAVTNELVAELGGGDVPVLTVYNKWDLVEEEPFTSEEKVCISVKDHWNFDELLLKMQKLLPETAKRMKLLIPYNESRLLDEIRVNGKVIDQSFEEGGTLIEALIDFSLEARLIPFIVLD